jgi:FkbM family methyltransferase
VDGFATAAIRRIGRVAAQHSRTRRPLEFLYRTFSPSVAVIRGGRGAGMKIKAASANVGYCLGTTEPVVQDAMADALAPGGVCYDLGANVGFFTLIAAKAVGETGRVYAFEPAPDTAAELRANVELNALDYVEVIEAAVSDSNGEAAMAADGDNLRTRLSPDGGVMVSTVALDALDLRPPDFIKIDVEGAERQALEGMRETIEQHQPTILLEMHMEGPVE